MLFSISKQSFPKLSGQLLSTHKRMTEFSVNYRTSIKTFPTLIKKIFKNFHVKNICWYQVIVKALILFYWKTPSPYNIDSPILPNQNETCKFYFDLQNVWYSTNARPTKDCKSAVKSTANQLENKIWHHKLLFIMPLWESFHDTFWVKKYSVSKVFDRRFRKWRKFIYIPNNRT